LDEGRPPAAGRSPSPGGSSLSTSAPRSRRMVTVRAGQRVREIQHGGCSQWPRALEAAPRSSVTTPGRVPATRMRRNGRNVMVTGAGRASESPTDRQAPRRGRLGNRAHVVEPGDAGLPWAGEPDEPHRLVAARGGRGASSWPARGRPGRPDAAASLRRRRGGRWGRVRAMRQLARAQAGAAASSPRPRRTSPPPSRSNARATMLIRSWANRPPAEGDAGQGRRLTSDACTARSLRRSKGRARPHHDRRPRELRPARNLVSAEPDDGQRLMTNEVRQGAWPRRRWAASATPVDTARWSRFMRPTTAAG